ncbi:MAG: hypothetical protein ABS939_03675 [Psychrobacillus sp.]
MKTPIMPQRLQISLAIAFREKDIDLIISLNKKWYKQVEEERKRQEAIK